jgi:hypothetical protein
MEKNSSSASIGVVCGQVRIRLRLAFPAVFIRVHPVLLVGQSLGDGRRGWIPFVRQQK